MTEQVDISVKLYKSLNILAVLSVLWHGVLIQFIHSLVEMDIDKATKDYYVVLFHWECKHIA